MENMIAVIADGHDSSWPFSKLFWLRAPRCPQYHMTTLERRSELSNHYCCWLLFYKNADFFYCYCTGILYFCLGYSSFILRRLLVPVLKSLDTSNNFSREVSFRDDKVQREFELISGRSISSRCCFCWRVSACADLGLNFIILHLSCASTLKNVWKCVQLVDQYTSCKEWIKATVAFRWLYDYILWIVTAVHTICFIPTFRGGIFRCVQRTFRGDSCEL